MRRHPRPRGPRSRSHVPREGRPLRRPPLPDALLPAGGQSRHPQRGAGAPALLARPPPRACGTSLTFSRPRRPITGLHHTGRTLRAGRRTLPPTPEPAPEPAPWALLSLGSALHPDPALPHPAANAGRGPRPSACPPVPHRGSSWGHAPAPALPVPGLLRPHPGSQPAQNARLNCPVRPLLQRLALPGSPEGAENARATPDLRRRACPRPAGLRGAWGTHILMFS